MNLISYLEIISNDSPNPCCFSDLETDEVVFLNRAMAKLLHLYEGYEGLNAHDLIYAHHNPPCSNLKKLLVPDQFVEHYVLHEGLDKHYRIHNTLLEVGGRRLNMCKYFVAPTFEAKQVSFEEAMSECAEILTFGDPPKIADGFLSLLGRFYQCDSSNIFLFDRKTGALKNLHLWSLDGILDPMPDFEDSFVLDSLSDAFQKSMRNGVLEIFNSGGNYRPETKAYNLFTAFRVNNLVLCPIKNLEDEVLGFVGLCNREQLQTDYRLLKSITRFLEESFSRHIALLELREISENDCLTGLYRRRTYINKLSEFQEHPPEALGIVFMNVNGLRKVNEVLGFHAGDRLIQEAASLITEIFPSDVYRTSGDEFVAFVLGTEEDAFVAKVEALHQLVTTRHENLFAIGHTWKAHCQEISKMVAEADTMMYINKQEYYQLSHKESGEVSNQVLHELLAALEQDEFMVYLQPQVRLSDEQVIGAEALIRRYSKAEQRMIFPDQFIPLYEQNSVIRHVDLFVVEQVCAMMAEWRKEGKLMPVSVNLSRVTLLEYHIPQILAEICDKYDIPHHMIVVEVTERVGLIENNVASSLIEQFTSLGFEISLDDFGCAYSNIVTLVKISVDEIKIDKSLVDDILTSEKNQIIVGNLLNMCNSFQNTKTLAEGIEYPEQAEILREYGCTHGQGYYFSRPMPADDFFQKYIKGTS